MDFNCLQSSYVAAFDVSAQMRTSFDCIQYISFVFNHNCRSHIDNLCVAMVICRVYVTGA